MNLLLLKVTLVFCVMSFPYGCASSRHTESYAQHQYVSSTFCQVRSRRTCTGWWFGHQCNNVNYCDYQLRTTLQYSVAYRCQHGWKTYPSCDTPICSNCATGTRCTAPNTCTDIDECSSWTHRCQHTCVNTHGSFRCQCNSGYTLHYDGRTCRDIDECAAGTSGCAQVCINTVGSYICGCNPGYRLEHNGRLCNDIDECVSGTSGCAHVCINTVGSYRCGCNTGYTLEQHGRSCNDNDECTLNTSECEQLCINDVGSYTCDCMSGFYLEDDGRSCTDKVCPDELDKEYSIHWSRTKAGTESYAPCPRNNSGTCSRNCSLGIAWSAPNCNGCFDKEFKELLEKVNKVNLTAFKNQTVIAKIASQLSTVTNKSEGLSPGNLNASVMMIKQLADLRTDSTINANAMEIKSIVQAANNVLQPNNSKSWQELEHVNQNIATSILFSLDVYGRSLAALNTSDHSIEVQDSLVLEAWSFEKSNLREIEFPNRSLWDENRGDGISISVEAFKNSMSSESPSALHMWGSYYRTVNDYLPGNEGGTDDVNSRVLSFSIDGLKTNERLERPVLITLRHNQEKRTSFQRTCAFWNFSGGNWDSVGCSVTSTNLTHTICSCDHLTNFAILMSLEPKEDWLLSLISIIGCSISVAALILTIFVYALTWKQAKSAQATVLLNLCVALIIAYIIFMVGADKVLSKGFSKIGCQAVAVLLHYFFLAAFFIMLAEGVELLLYIIFVFHVRRTRETVMLVISAWVLPLIIVGVSLGSTKLEGYGHEKACWLSSENHLIWAFVGPVLGIIAANFVILIIVLRWRSQKKALLSKNVKKRDEINATIWNLAVTCPVLGLGWLFGFLTLAFDHTVFHYMFVAVNSLQGLLIFIFHALFHNKRVNERISSLFSTYICSRCRNSDQAVITQSTSSSQDQPTKKADKKGRAPRGGMGKQGNVRGHGTQLTSFGDSETMESTQ